jgi:ARG and Rhodanese-Phosphatase-superfamily-associated Protein domain
MIRSTRAAVIVAVVLIAAAAACRDRGAPTAAAGDGPVAIAAAAAAARAQHARLGLGPGLELRRPIASGHVEVVPIVATGAAAAGPAYLTLDDGLARGQVIVRELRHDDDYSRLVVVDRSDRPLLVLAGELVVRGRQDRVFAESRILAAHSKEVVPVRCVELGRDDHGAGRHLASGHAMVDVGLRRVLRYGAQSEIWDAVDLISKARGLISATSSYRPVAEAQDQGLARARRAVLEAALDALPERDRIVGLAAAIDGEVVAIDRFDSPATFRALRHELIGSYLAGDVDAPREHGRLVPTDVRRLAAQANTTAVTAASTETLLPWTR